MPRSAFALFSMCLTLAACDPKTPPKAEPEPAKDEDQAKDAAESTKKEAPKAEPEEAKPEAPAGEVLSVDPKQSKVGFFVDRATTGHVAEFGRFDARLELSDRGQPTRLEIEVKLGSVAADRGGLTQHLKSVDFFNVDKFPTASFQTESIEAVADEPNEYEVKGTMRLHGVSQALEFPATIEVGPERALGTATLKISAKAFGIDYEGMEAELAEDRVSLEIELAFPRVASP